MATIGSTGLLPSIGASGIWKLAAPFDALLVNSRTYSCKAVRSFGDVAEAGFDVYKDYYEAYGLTKEKYELDASSGVAIVSISPESGGWIRFPSSYLIQFPSNNGVTYVSWALGAILGPLPESVDLSYLTATIKQRIMDVIGVDSDVRAVVVSDPEIIANQTHAGIESSRRANITESTTDYAKLQEALRQRDAFAVRIQELETFIKNNASKLQP